MVTGGGKKEGTDFGGGGLAGLIAPSEQPECCCICPSPPGDKGGASLFLLRRDPLALAPPVSLGTKQSSRLATISLGSYRDK